MFDLKLTTTLVGTHHGYNEEIRSYHVDVTVFGAQGLHEIQQAKYVRVIGALFETEGIGSSKVRSVEYVGLVGSEVQESMYSASGSVCGKYRFTVVVRTAGCD